MKRMSIALAVLLGLVACGAPITINEAHASRDAAIHEAAGSGSTVTLAAPTTTVPPTTTTTIDVAQAARDEYLSSVIPGNCVAERMDAVWVEHTGALDALAYEKDWAWIRDEYLPLYGQYSEAEVARMERLAAYEWPASVKTDITAIIGLTATNAQAYLDYSLIDDFDEWVDWVWTGIDAAPTSSIIRAKLGLETNVGTEVDFCSLAIKSAQSYAMAWADI